MRRVIAVLAPFFFGVGLVAGAAAGGGGAKQKHDIKEVMEQAHKKGLLKKIVAGSASAAEKQKLLELYVDLYDNKAPMGDAASWTKKTGDLVAAAAWAELGHEDAASRLKEAADCKGCHSVHNPNP